MFVSDTGVLCGLVTVSGQEAAPNPGGTIAMKFLRFFFFLGCCADIGGGNG